MFEYEYRLHVGLNSFKELQQILHSLNSFIHLKTVKFVKNFRCKDGVWEIKKKVNSYAVYHLSHWFQFVESEEKKFQHWNLDEYKSFYECIGFYQYPLTIEHRYQIELSNDAKIYGYVKNNTQFGLVFELEVKCCQKKKHKLPIDLEKLNEYSHILHLFSTGFILPYALRKCTRKRVYHTLEPISNAFVAVKHDGIFGFVYSYENYIYEMWEGNYYNYIFNTTLGNGFIFAAEKLKDGTVILLDVYQVRGCNVLHLESIFFDFLPNLSLPPHYKVQTYFKEYNNFLKNINEIDKMNIDKMNIDKMNIDKMNIDKMDIDKMEIDKMNINKMEIDKMDIDKMDFKSSEIKSNIDKMNINEMDFKSSEIKSNIDKMNINEMDCEIGDGIIFHTPQDKIFKLKPVKTIDLIYEDGYFILDNLKIPTKECLINGVVYECDLKFNSIKPRPDRFVSNTLEQINEVIPDFYEQYLNCM